MIQLNDNTRQYTKTDVFAEFSRNQYKFKGIFDLLKKKHDFVFKVPFGDENKQNSIELKLRYDWLKNNVKTGVEFGF